MVCEVNPWTQKLNSYRQVLTAAEVKNQIFFIIALRKLQESLQVTGKIAETSRWRTKTTHTLFNIRVCKLDFVIYGGSVQQSFRWNWRLSNTALFLDMTGGERKSGELHPICILSVASSQPCHFHKNQVISYSVRKDSEEDTASGWSSEFNFLAVSQHIMLQPYFSSIIANKLFFWSIQNSFIFIRRFFYFTSFYLFQHSAFFFLLLVRKLFYTCLRNEGIFFSDFQFPNFILKESCF